MRKVEISNFRDVVVSGNSPLDYTANATIDVKTTTGIFRKKVSVESVRIHKTFAGAWYYIETGVLCGGSVNDMQRSYEAKNGPIFKVA